MKLEGQAERLMKELSLQGRVQTISTEETVRIESNLAEKLITIKQNFELYERNAWAQINERESGNMGLYLPKEDYHK